LYFIIHISCTLKINVKFILEQTTKAHRRSRGVALLLLNLGARWGGWSMPHPVHFTPSKDPVSTLKEAGWALRLVWMDAEIVTPLELGL
jgi:hypothetical protein